MSSGLGTTELIIVLCVASLGLIPIVGSIFGILAYIRVTNLERELRARDQGSTPPNA